MRLDVRSGVAALAVVLACAHGCAQSSRIDDDDGSGGANVTVSGSASATASTTAQAGSASSVVVSSTTSTATASVSASTGAPDPCGNGAIDAGEECDDQNAVADDGCTACLIDCDTAAGELKAASNHHCYRFVPVQTGWAAAEADCVAWGKAPGLGHLASIGDATENDFVRAMAGAGIWIGASDTAVEGAFAWTDGTPFAFESWASGEPNDDGTEDCVVLQPNGQWRDTECGGDRIYVCERSGAGE